jgi:hypothetical protein
MVEYTYCCENTECYNFNVAFSVKAEGETPTIFCGPCGLQITNLEGLI